MADSLPYITLNTGGGRICYLKIIFFGSRVAPVRESPPPSRRPARLFLATHPPVMYIYRVTRRPYARKEGRQEGR